MLIRNASYPGPKLGSWAPPLEPAPNVSTGNLERDIVAYAGRHGLSIAQFAEAVGQSTCRKNGLIAKIRADRLKPATVAKIRRFMETRRAPE